MYGKNINSETRFADTERPEIDEDADNGSIRIGLNNLEDEVDILIKATELLHDILSPILNDGVEYGEVTMEENVKRKKMSELSNRITDLSERVSFANTNLTRIRNRIDI